MNTRVRVFEEAGDWQVRLEVEDVDSLRIGSGSTRNEAVADAVSELEDAVCELQKPVTYPDLEELRELLGLSVVARWFLALALVVVLVTLAAPSFAAEEFGPVHGRILRIVDGDTVEVDAELWPNTHYRGLVRLNGINTAEIRAKASCEREAARAASKSLAGFAGREAVIDHVRSDKYSGRVLGSISVDGHDLAQAQIAAGHARPYAGGLRGPWCED